MRRVKRLSAVQLSLSRETLNKFYDDLQQLILDHNLHADQIFNLDETGVDRPGAKSHVAVSADAKEAPGVIDTSKEHITIVACVCADGSKMPPFFLFKGAEGSESRVSLLNRCPADWMWAQTGQTPLSQFQTYIHKHTHTHTHTLLLTHTLAR